MAWGKLRKLQPVLTSRHLSLKLCGKVYMAWGKLRKLQPVLTSRHLFPKVCGKVYAAGVPSAVLCGSETWGPNILDLKEL